MLLLGACARLPTYHPPHRDPDEAGWWLVLGFDRDGALVSRPYATRTRDFCEDMVRRARIGKTADMGTLVGAACVYGTLGQVREAFEDAVDAVETET